MYRRKQPPDVCEISTNGESVSLNLGVFPMQAHVKNALMTTALVLATIFILRRVPVTRDVVDKALAG